MRIALVTRAVQSHKLTCLILLLAHYALSAQFAMTLPALESFDEPAHYAYARYIAVNHTLPPPQGVGHEPYEMHQPPLYYVAVALGISGIDVSDDVHSEFLWGVHVAVKPDVRLNDVTASGTALAIRMGRLASALMSTIAVWCTYLAVRALFPRRVDLALLATGLHAFWPMGVFMGGVISNDVGIGLAGSLMLLIACRLVFGRTGATRGSRLADYLAFGFVAGLAVLMKDSAIALLLFYAAVLLVLVVRELVNRRLAEPSYAALSVVLAGALLIAGWIWSDGRSLRQFTTSLGFATNISSQIIGTQGAVAAGGDYSMAGVALNVLENAGNVFRSLFGVFGRGSLALPETWYAVAAIGALICGAGVVLALVRRGGCMRRRILFMLAFTAFVVAAPLVRVLTSGAVHLMHGRFMLPAFGAISILLAVGILAFPRWGRRVLAVVSLAGLAFVSLCAPPLVIAPLFKRSPVFFAPAGDPFVAPNATSITFGNALELMGYELYAPHTARGGSMSILIYWRALRPLPENYVLRLEGFSVSGKSFGSFVESEPALGAFPTSQWKPGEVYREGYYLLIWDHVQAPTIGTFKATWIDPRTKQDLPTVCGNAQSCDPKIGAVPISLDAAEQSKWSNATACCQLGQQIELLSARAADTVSAGQPLTVSLVWRARAGTLPPLTTFVHLLTTEGKLAAQADTPVRGGEYPTQVWVGGDVVPDEVVLMLPAELPPGAYSLNVGMYDPATLVRLPATDQQGRALANDMIPVQSVQVHSTALR